ncbi:MAG: ABC-type branched-chain amino acid transport system, ATPase component [Haloquadratum walsbyi J07HQW2]|jgi:ABC-type branched-chain amino acid transport systems, ATPase component|uniref:ABC-type branched-chain amino acid transport system, ATPase component n=2 Tax=Haloquadratum walsbyi TaxID=293091 RepID=U1PXJ1_9EURY|nr:MAG: ABC-type branched-chain amino acid transport system, ATPase component [Haloquadratum walsbyi J07HQW2]
MTETQRVNSESVLEIDGLRKEFPGVAALDGVSLEIREREIVGIIGPNGAGKSTLFNCIMGVHEPTDGEIYLDKKTDITGEFTSRIVRKGVSRAFQQARVFPGLTVRENMVANQDHEDENIVTTLFNSAEATERMNDLVRQVGLWDLRDRKAGELSTGQKKLLTIAAALMQNPEIVMLDEPTAGVNPNLVDDIIDTIIDLNHDGATFCIIEHDMDVIHTLSDYVYVLNNGMNLTEGPPDVALDDPDVLEAYFGE